jgi:hypothetical protein
MLPKSACRVQPKSARKAGFCTPIAAHCKFQILHGKRTLSPKEMRRTLNALVRAVTDGAHQAIAVSY